VATKLNRERTFALLDALYDGATTADAARAAGVHPSTVYRWLEKGREPGARRCYQLFAWRFDWGHWPYPGPAGAAAWFAERAGWERQARAEIDARVRRAA